MIDNIIELIRENKEWLFGGVGGTAVVAIFNFFRNKNKGEGELQKNQFASNNAVNVQAQGDVSIGSINSVDRKIPETLAKPEFSIKQVSFSSGGRDGPEYGFELYNGGGNCFNVEVSSDRFSKTFKFPKISRGCSVRIITEIPFGTDFLGVKIKGFNENGDNYSQFVSGPRERSGFKLQ